MPVATLPYPKTCPTCSAQLSTRGPHLICGNPLCPEKIKGLLSHAAKRSNFDIVGLGDEVADALVASGLVRNLADLFKIDKTALARMNFAKGSFGSTRADKLWLAIMQAAEKKPWNVVLHSLGCPGLGEPESDKISAKYTLAQLLSMSTPLLKMQLLDLPGIGEKTSVVFAEWVRINIDWLQDIDELLNTEPQKVDPKSQPLLGYTVVVTGSFEVNARSYYEAELKRLGAAVSGSVSKNTTLLAAGHGTEGGKKLEAATKFGVKVIGEPELIKLIGG